MVEKSGNPGSLSHQNAWFLRFLGGFFGVSEPRTVIASTILTHPDCRGANWIAMLRLEGEETAASEVESVFFLRSFQTVPFSNRHIEPTCDHLYSGFLNVF